MEVNAMERVAVIGTGAIGSPMARCLIRAGFQTTVYDARREAVESLVAMGA
jgi:3-hydroxyisobutyrate dehydrogenase-like beta-hydroxyacid dehydrogenase